MYGTIKIFYEMELSQFLDSLKDEMKATVHGETAQYLANVNEDEYAKHLLSRFCVEPLIIHFDQMTVSAREEQIPADQFPSFGFDREDMQGTYPKQVIRYHIPYEGTEELLRCRPSPWLVHTHSVLVEGGYICFDIIDFYSDPGRIKQQADSILDLIRRQWGNLCKNVEDYNARIPGQIKEVVQQRKKQLQDQFGIVSALGVPIRKNPDVPTTFRVPQVRKKIIAKPSAPSVAGKPEPTLGDDDYIAILQVIHDAGKVFERLPSTYAGKDEETLRDHLILVLEPNFEGSTTGETFNKSGKTDILLRHEKSNIFVAECKYWNGGKKHLETIDQLLGYLTWRDSKTAIICFVDRKDFSRVLSEIESTTKQHSCYVRYIGAREATWLNFEFHLPGDPGRYVKIAVMAFHLPKL